MHLPRRIEEIRAYEKRYHDEIYETALLFKEGSWLRKPVATVMDAFELLSGSGERGILDLGCGVGRNSIPLARRLKETGGNIVCVDLLSSAIENLKRYAEQYEVLEYMVPVQSDIAAFPIMPNQYDYVVSVSTLEHLHSQEAFEQVIDRLMMGTRPSGVHCFLINANIRETEVATGVRLSPMFELLFRTDELIRLLTLKYRDWSVMRSEAKGYSLDITRDDKPVRLESDVVTWIAQKRLE